MSKPNRLSGLIQPKGAARRPADMPQRGEPAPPPVATAPVEPVQPAAAAKPEKPPQKSLTLKMDEPDYEVLREFAHRRRKTHQDVMLEAVLRYLRDEGAMT